MDAALSFKKRSCRQLNFGDCPLFWRSPNSSVTYNHSDLRQRWQTTGSYNNKKAVTGMDQIATNGRKSRNTEMLSVSNCPLRLDLRSLYFGVRKWEDSGLKATITKKIQSQIPNFSVKWQLAVSGLVIMPDLLGINGLTSLYVSESWCSKALRFNITRTLRIQ